MIFSLSKFPFRSLSFSRLLVSYKKILSTYFYSANSFSSVSVGFPFVSGFFCLHAFLSFRINLFKLAFFLNMKIIFAFRTRLSFLYKRKNSLYYLLCSCQSSSCFATHSYLRQQPRSSCAFSLRSGLRFSSRVPSVPFSASDLLLQ